MGVVHKNKRNSILLGQDNNALTWLIIINVTVFIFLNFIKIIYMISDSSSMVAFQVQILDWVILPGQPEKLAEKPWTIFTYMFTHIDVWPMIGTTIWLWWFGYILQDLSGNSRLAPVYIYSGLAGAFVFVLTTFFIPQLSSATPGANALIGGGASVMGVALATTVLAPGYRIFPMLNGGIPLWIVTLIFVAIDFATIGSTSGNYALAHLAGGLMGYLFVVQLRRGYDMGAWMVSLGSWLNDLFNPEKKYKKAPLKKSHFYKATKKPFEKTARLTEQKIDELLDKISKEGYHSLTDEEKELLKKASNEEY